MKKSMKSAIHSKNTDIIIETWNSTISFRIEYNIQRRIIAYMKMNNGNHTRIIEIYDKAREIENA